MLRWIFCCIKCQKHENKHVWPQTDPGSVQPFKIKAASCSLWRRLVSGPRTEMLQWCWGPESTESTETGSGSAEAESNWVLKYSISILDTWYSTARHVRVTSHLWPTQTLTPDSDPAADRVYPLGSVLIWTLDPAERARFCCFPASTSSGGMWINCHSSASTPPPAGEPLISLCQLMCPYQLRCIDHLTPDILTSIRLFWWCHSDIISGPETSTYQILQWRTGDTSIHQSIKCQSIIQSPARLMVRELIWGWSINQSINQWSTMKIIISHI